MRRRFSMLGVALALAIPAAGAPGVASADGRVKTVDLGLASFGGIAVDPVNEHVVISEPVSDRVLVFNYSGVQVATIKNEPSVSGIVVHGGVVYVVQESSAGSIDRFDAASFKKLGKLTHGLDYPFGLEFAGGRLWTTVPDPGRTLASVDPTSGNTHIFDLQSNGPILATSPGLPTALFQSDETSPDTIYRYDVSGAAPVVVASTSNTFPGEACYDLTVSKDGRHVVPGCGAPYEFVELHAATLKTDGIIYPASFYTRAVASTTGPGTSLFAGAYDHSNSDTVFEIFKYGQPQAIRTVKMNSSKDVVPQGMAFSGDGATLFAISTQPKSDGTHYFFSTIRVS